MEHCGRFYEGAKALLQNSLISGYLCTDQIPPEENPKLVSFLVCFISFQSIQFHSWGKGSWGGSRYSIDIVIFPILKVFDSGPEGQKV